MEMSLLSFVCRMKLCPLEKIGTKSTGDERTIFSQKRDPKGVKYMPHDRLFIFISVS